MVSQTSVACYLVDNSQANREAKRSEATDCTSFSSCVDALEWLDHQGTDKEGERHE